jgi:MYXO-CTERM domain-containing protein
MGDSGRFRTAQAGAAILLFAGCHSVTPLGSSPDAGVPQELISTVVREAGYSDVTLSWPFAELADVAPISGGGHDVRHLPRQPWGGTPSIDATPWRAPTANMPLALQNFAGQGNLHGGPCGTGTCSAPPDTDGAVGPSHYVQIVNINGSAGIAIWDKSGALLSGPKHTNTLWTGYSNTDGNGCATRDDGDGVVLYDWLADRWLITQFSLPNQSTAAGPSFQCVAVSQTGDPTGAYYLYDFKYSYAINDYGKFGVWPDGYYATFNMFTTTTFAGDDFCVYDRTSMLAGLPATQQCFLQAYPSGTPPACPATQPFGVFAALPVSFEGTIPPPNGEPAHIVQFDYSQCGPTYNQLDLWDLHVDWTTPANSTVTGPTVLTVNNFTPSCFNAQTTYQGKPFHLENCMPQGASTTTVDGLDDRLMFRLSYRNFGAYESMLVDHSVSGGGGGTSATCSGCAGSAVRWYEIQLQPGGTNPTVAQQQTYAPADNNWRWMASLAQDAANDIALGFSVSSKATPGVVDPSIAWTGHLNSDPLSTMGQAESVVVQGGGVEGDEYPAAAGSPDQHRGRWGDYSAMAVDPADDCTFWYTDEYYNTNGTSAWDTQIASVKFPNCRANDFSITSSPTTQTLAHGTTTTYTINTAVTAGVTETIALYVQSLPAGVTGAFVPTSVTTGGSSTLTLTASATATTGTVTFDVIGKATSAVHRVSPSVTVTGCTPLTTCPPPDNCGTIGNGCGGTVSCTGVCTLPQSCGGGGTANVCGCTSNPIATTCAGKCGSVIDNCNVAVACGVTYCTPPANSTATCSGNTCGFTCNAGFHNCGGVCVSNSSVNSCGTTSCTACPADPNGVATCNGTSCGITCNAGFHNCGGVCVSNSNVNSCGTTSCTPCAAPANANATCDGTSCGFTCNSGFHACGTSCSSDTDVNQCGASCMVCSAATDACHTAVCSSGACGIVAIPGCTLDMAGGGGLVDMASGGGVVDMAGGGGGDDLSGGGGDDLSGVGGSDLSGGPKVTGGCGCQVGGVGGDLGAPSLAVVVLLGLLLRRRPPRRRARLDDFTSPIRTRS